MRPGICLATRSPRRLELFDALRIPFRTVYSPDREPGGGILESGLGAEELARSAAEVKVLNAEGVDPAEICLGFDTVVALDGLVLGKPETRERAAEMLLMLSEREHRVITAVAMSPAGRRELLVEAETTTVRFGVVTPEQAASYAATGEPMDKAGAYGIQGLASVFVQGVRGCWFNVVGLPVFRLAGMLSGQGIEISRFWTERD